MIPTTVLPCSLDSPAAALGRVLPPVLHVPHPLSAWLSLDALLMPSAMIPAEAAPKAGVCHAVGLWRSSLDEGRSFRHQPAHAQDRHGRRAGRADNDGPSGSGPRLGLPLHRPALPQRGRQQAAAAGAVPGAAGGRGRRDDAGPGHPAAQPAQPRLHGRDGGLARRHRPRQLHLRRRPRLPRRRVRRLRRAQGRAAQALRGIPGAGASACGPRRACPTTDPSAASTRCT